MDKHELVQIDMQKKIWELEGMVARLQKQVSELKGINAELRRDANGMAMELFNIRKECMEKA